MPRGIVALAIVRTLQQPVVDLLAVTVARNDAKYQVHNLAMRDLTTLNTLFTLLRGYLALRSVSASLQPVHREFRACDIHCRQADIGKAQNLLGYKKMYPLAKGIAQAMLWYVAQK